MTPETTTPTVNNPYASPNEASELPPPEDWPVPSFLNALGRWTLICSISAISAISSFTLGMEGKLLSARTLAMIAGIIFFSIAYAFVDRTMFWRRMMVDPVTRKSIYWAYGIRMVASAIVPVGSINDLFVFMLLGGMFFAPFGMLEAGEPFDTFGRTVAQGIALNVQMAAAVVTVKMLFQFFGRDLADSKS